ncbi:hypothetical protein AUJ46_05100 [Candidatus Peregrinibacteria bacterium CG1_02_54_53]|nr:MAG: hypothetical protein AUJ46_05100 [Candidatus Peregrinibacteria bacterium CG1_02_54_53]
MVQPRVAVYMPAYEAKKEHIRPAVESVLVQSYTDWALLINDDASVRENVESHVQDYLSDPRITFCRNSKNLGIGANWNVCWQQDTMEQAREGGLCPPGAQPLREGWVRAHSTTAQGTLSLPKGGRDTVGGPSTQEFVAFLFHDDLWEPIYLEHMLAALDANPSAGFAAANHSYIKEGDVSRAPFYDELREFVRQNVRPGLHEHPKFLHWWLQRGLKPNVIGEPSFVMLRRSLMEQVGPFNASMMQFLDSEYWARCLLHADFVYVDESLGKFRVHPGGMSATNEGQGRGIFERFQTLQTVVAGLPSEERKFGNTAIVHALSGMIGQYISRRKQGKNISRHGSNGLRKFVLRHPILTLLALFKWMMGKKT